MTKDGRINKEKQLSARVAVALQEPTIWEDWANTDYEGDIKNQGDTVTVQNFPIVEWDVSDDAGTAVKKAGKKIPVKDWALGESEIKADQVANINLEIKDIEKAVSNLNLEQGLRTQITLGYHRVKSRYIQALAIKNAGSEVGTEADPIFVTKENSLDVTGEIEERLDYEFVPAEGRALFARSDLCGILRKSSSFDGTEIGAKARMKGVLGEVDGFTLIKDSTMPKGKAVALDKNSVHFVSKLTKIKTVPGEYNNEGFFGNILGESVYGGNVLDLNKKRICLLHYKKNAVTTP